MSSRPWLVAVLLGLVTTIVLALAHRQVGYVRDEGIYFAASRHYAAWFGDLLADPAHALSRAQRDHRFRVNHEHPALLKSAAGLSASLLARAPAPGTEQEGLVDDGGVLPVMDEGAAMRLPAQLLTGLGVALLYLVAAAHGGALAGLLAAGSFVLLPHVAFHAGLHAFDVPVATAILAVVLAYRRALGDRRWGVAVGVVLGFAIAVKHNALFLGPLLALHHTATLAWARWREGRRVRPLQWIGLPLLSMAVLAPLVAVALWPWLWAEPIARIGEYFAFHRQHAYYNMEFLGHNYNQPPMPIAYPFVMTWATVPSVLLVLVLVGAVVTLRHDWRVAPRQAADGDADGSFWTPVPRTWSRHDGLLFGMMAAFPLLLIALPSTPIFGGTKHWITAYPFFALLAARAWTALFRGRPWPRWCAPAALAAVLLPGTISTIDGHPWGMSQYAPLLGGARGGAEIGLGRGFWGHAVAPALPGLGEHLGNARRLYVHDMHELAVLQYQREGRWPPGIESVALGRAQAGLLFHELHMASWEYRLWEQLGTAAPVEVVALDGVPLVSVYREP